jgi:hypothetical protein
MKEVAMALPRYLRPIKDQKSYEPGPGERFVRALVFLPLGIVIFLPATLVIAALAFGGVFVFPALIDMYPWQAIAVVALTIASIVVSQVIFRKFLIY